MVHHHPPSAFGSAIAPAAARVRQPRPLCDVSPLWQPGCVATHGNSSPRRRWPAPAGPGRLSGELARGYPDAHCELDFSTPSSWRSPPSCRRRPPTSGSTWSPRRCSRGTATAADYAAADRGRAGGADQVDRLLPEQGDLADRSGPGAGRAVRRRGAATPCRAGHACPGSAARRRTWCWATRSACPGITVDTHLRPAGPALGADRADRSGQGRGRAERPAAAGAVDRLLRPDDLPRPAGLPRANGRPAVPASSPRCARPTGRADRSGGGRRAGGRPGTRPPARAGRAGRPRRLTEPMVEHRSPSFDR